MRPFTLVTLFLFVLATFAAAQRAASPAHVVAPPGSTALHHDAFAIGHGTYLGSRPRRSSTFDYAPYSSLPFPFFGDSFDPDDVYSTGYPVASQPPASVLQAAQDMLGSAAASASPDMMYRSQREPQSSQPLLIELQGGQYVRVARTPVDGGALRLSQGSNLGSNHDDARPVTPTSRQTDRSLAIATAPAKSVTPAVLVFRDGHSEEVRDYAITDGALYARGDYYTDGYWNKKIELSSLDIAQTLQANLSRNVNFVLPSSPNEVITRP
jgi:hypothetical protein